MSHYLATVSWTRDDNDFLANKYSRAHSWTFDGGLTMPASPSPHIVKEPWSEPANVDPEEAFVASLSSCHMLFFLSIAAEEGVLVNSYTDEAIGVMARNDEGKYAMTEVTLRPHIQFDPANPPEQSLIDNIHHRAHEQCFIANSVRTAITIESS